MARGPLTQDDVDDIELSGEGPVDHPASAARWEAMAADPHPQDEVSAADLLVHAGEHWAYADEPERALACFRQAIDDGHPVAPDTRCYLLHGLLGCGLREEAVELASAVRAERPKDPDVYGFMGEAFEAHGDLQSATRWFTTGMFRAMRDDDVAESAVTMLIWGRQRVREAQGLPPDDFDEVALSARTQLAGPGWDDPS